MKSPGEDAMFVKIALSAILALSWSISWAGMKLTALENFDSGSVTLVSWADEDISPNSWSLEGNTPDGSPYCLRLYGNTWKLQQLNPYAIDSIGVVQLKARTTDGGKVQGIGFTDGTHELFYSFSGTRIVDIEAWVPVYQGAFAEGSWQTYQLPLAADWQAFFEYLPIITGIIYINDMDGVNTRSVYFDAIEDISADLPVAPVVNASQGSPVRNGRNVGIQFTAEVYDPDSSEFSFAWDFGDNTSSSQQNPYHTYTDTALHPYTVCLKVTDNTGRCGYDTTFAVIDPANEPTLPVTMNFVGDIMLARRYEYAGGIIPTQGVNAIFAPTRALFGEGADLNVANLEVILSNQGVQHPTKSVAYRGSPANISGLVYAGIDNVSLANNHTLDWGITALQQMQGILGQTGIEFSGAGANSYEAYLPSFVNKRGLNIAFLRSCDRTGQYNDAQPYLQAGFNKPGFAYMTPYYIAEQIAAVEDVADLMIAELHSGSEYSLTPGEDYDKSPNPFIWDTEDEDYNYRSDIPHQWDIAIRHSTIDSGADLVIVHHPHIIQGLEVYNNKLIAHSLGNFVFDLDYPETMPSMILYADADFDGFRNYRVKPIFIDRYIPRPATGQLGIRILDYLAARSRELNTRLAVDRNAMEARVLMADENPPITTNFWSTTQNLTLHQGYEQQTAPIKLPRQGSISGIISAEPASEVSLRLGQETIWWGDFEDEGTAYWAPPQYSTTDTFDGARSALLVASGTSAVTCTIPDRCKWYDNTKKYTLHGWMKTNNVTSANFLIRYYSSRTTGTAMFTENVSTAVSGSTDWTYYYKELTIPANAYYYDIRLTVSGPSGSAYALFDNIGLIEWTEYSLANSLADIPWPNNYYWMQAKTVEDAKSLSIYLNEKSFGTNRPRYTGKIIAKPHLELYPNPFNPTLNITLDLPKSAPTSLKIYNLKGQFVRELLSAELTKGKHLAVWDAKDAKGRQVASGIYFIRVDNGGDTTLRKAILLK